MRASVISARPLYLLPLGLALILVGCGASSPVATTQPTPTPSASTLAGNWLLYGVMPKAVGSSTNQPGLGVSFDAIGNQVVAAAAINTTCSNSSATFGFRMGAIATGTVASDASFSITSPQGTIGPVLTISGSAPATSRSAWSGTYTLTNPSNLCPVTQTGPFTATPVSDLSGTYTGGGALYGATNPATLSLTLSQGAPLYSAIVPTSVNSRLGIAGSIQIQGFSCFSKGTSSTTAPSEVEGGPFLVNFTMDDGSTLNILGSIDDTAASQLEINSLAVTGGHCSGIYDFGLKPLLVNH